MQIGVDMELSDASCASLHSPLSSVLGCNVSFPVHSFYIPTVRTCASVRQLAHYRIVSLAFIARIVVDAMAPILLLPAEIFRIIESLVVGKYITFLVSRIRQIDIRLLGNLTAYSAFVYVFDYLIDWPPH